MYLIRTKIKALSELKISFAFSEKNYLKIPAFKFFSLSLYEAVSSFKCLILFENLLPGCFTCNSSPVLKQIYSK